MPAPARTSRADILAAADDILEEEGLEALTMAAVAGRVGVRGPSLYKHVPTRMLLIRAVAEQVVADLGTVIATAADSDPDPAVALRAVADAYRSFVRVHPNGYGLLFAHLTPEAMPDVAMTASVGLPIVRRMEELTGPENALEAARTLAAWAHGFVSMEQAGAFLLGGDVDAAYRFGVDAVIAGAGRRSSNGRSRGRRSP